MLKAMLKAHLCQTNKITTVFIILLFVVGVTYLGLLILPHKTKVKSTGKLPPASSPTDENSNYSLQAKEIEINNFSLVIPKLDLEVPIIPRVDGNDKVAYFAALQNGVAHYKGTKLPGEGGNIFIFGHSSYYKSDPGKYKTVFRSLNSLVKGDEIEIILNDKSYYYLVSDKKFIEPTETSYLANTASEQLTLMTCWPPGTYQQRLIVIAKPK